MKIQTTRFGELNIPAACIIRFVAGLIGFPRYKRFALFPFEENSPFYFLHSVSNPDLMFLLVDPYRFFSGYVFELEDGLAQELGFSDENPPGVYAITTLRDKLEEASVNLLGPVLVNWKNRTAVQITLQNSNFLVRQPLFPEGLDQNRQKTKKVKPVRQVVRNENYESRQEAI